MSIFQLRCDRCKKEVGVLYGRGCEDLCKECLIMEIKQPELLRNCARKDYLTNVDREALEYIANVMEGKK